MKKLLLAVGMASLLSGCATLGPSYVEVKAPFDKAAAERQMKPGNNTLTGQAFLRQLGGGVVTCAGGEVALIPDTAYARERLQILYGSLEKGFVPMLAMRYGSRKVPSKEEAEGYRKNIRQTKCNAQGEFSFKNVGDGVWYVTTGVVWEAGATQGGYLMERVELKDGETKEVLITN